MNRSLLTVPLALAISMGFLVAVAGPAQAREANCGDTSAIRAAAAAAEPGAAKTALRQLDIGVKLCEAGNERAASRKFATAARLLGVENAQQFAQKAR